MLFHLNQQATKSRARLADALVDRRGWRIQEPANLQATSTRQPPLQLPETAWLKNAEKQLPVESQR
jgi:hypothetical protein